MRNILCNKNLSMEIRKQVLKRFINTILYYGSEAWTMNKRIENNWRQQRCGFGEEC
jgi:hypothetical protein